MNADRVADPAFGSTALATVAERVDAELGRFLQDRRAELAAMAPAAVVLVDEMLRLLAAGGKRIRPALCLWAHRAAGGSDGPTIVRASAALELLHLFALVHDDVMDRTDERRGVPATHARFAEQAPPGRDPAGFGTSVAILVGDLAAVLAEQLLRTCGAEPTVLATALSRFDRMRAEMAAGQLLDVLGRDAGASSSRVAALKTGSYTAEGPVLVGAALAGAGPEAEGPLRAYASRLGEAFQLRDDVLDGDAAPEAARHVDDLVRRACASIEDAALEASGRDALLELAGLIALRGGP